MCYMFIRVFICGKRLVCQYLFFLRGRKSYIWKDIGSDGLRANGGCFFESIFIGWEIWVILCYFFGSFQVLVKWGLYLEFLFLFGLMLELIRVWIYFIFEIFMELFWGLIRALGFLKFFR